MLKLMPRTKPQQIKPDVEACRSAGTRSPASTRPRPSCRRSSSSCATPGRFAKLGAQVPEGHPAARTARHRQDAAGQGRRARVRRAVLRAVGGLLRRDVRRASAPRASGACSRCAQARAGDHLHRRARRRRRPPRHGHLRREGPDAQPAARRDGRLRLPAGAWSSSPPPTCSRSSTRRCCAPAASTARCSSRRPTSPAASGILERPHARQAAGRASTSSWSPRRRAG